MIKKIGAERRKFPRAKRVMFVQHRIYRRRGKKIMDKWHISTTENMSITGLLFASDVVYRHKDLIELKIVMSGALDIYSGYGEVVRIDRKKHGAIYYVAVKYKFKKRAAKK